MKKHELTAEENKKIWQKLGYQEKEKRELNKRKSQKVVRMI